MLDDYVDKIDQKIIKALMKDSRTPMSVVAKKALISRQGCFYRIKRLEEEGIILGYKAKIDSSKLGFSAFCIYLKTINLSTEDEQVLIDKISQMKQVRWLVTSTGRWDLMVSVSARNNIEFNVLLKEILKIFGDNILHYETSILLSITNLFMQDKLTKPTELSESAEGEPLVLDKTDSAIVSLLQKDARLEATAIAKQVKLTPEAVSYRIKNLVKSGVIHSFDMRLNLEKFNLTWYQMQFMLKNIDENEEKILLSKLKMIDGIAYIIRMIGKWNFEINMYCQNVSDFRDRLLEIRTMLSGYIIEYDTNIILKKYKSSTFIG